jgi:hypothetical protein
MREIKNPSAKIYISRQDEDDKKNHNLKEKESKKKYLS